MNVLDFQEESVICNCQDSTLRLLLERTHNSLLKLNNVEPAYRDWFKSPTTSESDVDSNVTTQELHKIYKECFSSLNKSQDVYSWKKKPGRTKVIDEQQKVVSSTITSVTNLSRHKLTKEQLPL